MKTLILIKMMLISMMIFEVILGQTIPQTINYQGVLKDASGNIVPNGSYDLTFTLYDDEVGGTDLWFEIKNLTVVDGIVNAKLGLATPLPANIFNTALWLGIKVGAGAELTPRIGLSSVPYSFYTMNVLDGSITASKIADGQVIKSLNGLKDNVTFVAGSNVTITPGGQNITISAAGGGGGTVSQVNTGAGLTGGPITTTGTVSVANDGITSAMLQSNSVTSTKIVDGTVATTDLANNSVTTDKIFDGTITAGDIGNTQVVKSINSIKDNVNLVAGSNVTITPSGQNITISATSGGGGIGGSGTTNYLPLFNNSTTLGSSTIYQTTMGGIGVGLSNPTGKFEILHNSDDSYPHILLSEADDFARVSFRTMTASSKHWVLAGSTDPNDNWSDWHLHYFNGSVGKNIISVYGNSNISFNGKVGIGTDSPSYPLHIATNRRYAGYFTSDSLSGNTHTVHSEFLGTGNFDAAGVYGKSAPTDYYGYGGYFEGGYTGVIGRVLATGSNDYFGVFGYANTSGTGGNKYGVLGEADGAGTNYGIYGIATGGTTNWAGYFYGNVNVTGTLSKGGGSFKIDHPLDPTNKNLYHSFVESPDMMNIYNGNVVTDATGYATVTMPDWFEALNKDFRYQLTVIGDFAQAIISQKIQNNQFIIRTDKPGIEVSWQVTGIRHDKFAEKYRIPVEENKTGNEVGKYLHPDAYGASETLGVDYENHKVNRDKK